MSELVTYFWDVGTSGWANDPTYMWDGVLTNYAYTDIDNQVQDARSTTGPGTDLGNIVKIEMRFYGHGDGGDQIGGYFTGGALDDYLITMPGSADWTAYIDVTADTNVGGWTWAKVADLYGEASKVFFVQYAKDGKANILYCGKVEIRVTYNIPGAAIVNQFQKANIGCDLYDGTLII